MKKILVALVCAANLVAAEGGRIAEKEVLGAMEALKAAMIQKDGAALDRLLGDDLMYTHSAGQLETKADFMKSIVSGKSIVERLDFMDTTVHVYGNTALVKGKVDLYHSNTNIVHMDVLHVWVKSRGTWRMVARQATRLAK